MVLDCGYYGEVDVRADVTQDLCSSFILLCCCC